MRYTAEMGQTALLHCTPLRKTGKLILQQPNVSVFKTASERSLVLRRPEEESELPATEQRETYYSQCKDKG